MYLLLFTVDGEGCLQVNGEQYQLSAGCVAIIPPRAPHAYCTAPGQQWEFYWLHPQGRMADALLGFIDTGYCRFDCDTAYFSEKIEQLLFMKTDFSANFELKASGILHDIFQRTLLLFCSTKHEAADAQKTSAARQIVQYLEKHYQEDVSLDQISKKLYLSETHIVRVMKKDIGYTPHQYLIRYRIIKASQLLAYSQKSVAEIAADVGFHQTSNFIKQFHRITGHSPNAERE